MDAESGSKTRAVAGWTGGLLYLVTERGSASYDASARLVSDLALVAVGLVSVTGLVQTWIFLDSFESLMSTVYGRLIVLKNGRYDNVPVSVVTSTKKVVDVKKFYNTERLRPFYHSFEMQPMLIMTSEG